MTICTNLIAFFVLTSYSTWRYRADSSACLTFEIQLSLKLKGMFRSFIST